LRTLNLFRNIKNLFFRSKFYHDVNFNLNDYEIKFRELTENNLLDIGNYIIKNIKTVTSVEDLKNQLTKEDMVFCETIDNLLITVQKIIHKDYLTLLAESEINDWDFHYFIRTNILNEETISVYTALTKRGNAKGHAIYTLLSIRKWKEHYYCWECS
jgi:hypothetical protein